jgi:heat shock protein HtpX
MYRAIERNKRYSIALIGLFALIVVALSTWLSIAAGSPWPAILVIGFTGGYTWWQLRSALKHAAKHAGCVEVSNAEEPELCRIVENLAIRNGMPRPKVCVIEDAEPNALALGMSPENALVAATRGLLNSMTPTELEAVMAHEMAHIKNYDSRVKLTLFALVGSIAVIASALIATGVALVTVRIGFKNKMFFAAIGLGVLLIASLFAIVAYLIGPLVSAGVSRKREYLADASAFEMTRYGDALVTALQKIESSPRQPRPAAIATQSFYFSSPLRGGFFASWMASHPSTEKRVERLEAMEVSF